MGLTTLLFQERAIIKDLQHLEAILIKSSCGWQHSAGRQVKTGISVMAICIWWGCLSQATSATLLIIKVSLKLCWRKSGKRTQAWLQVLICATNERSTLNHYSLLHRAEFMAVFHAAQTVQRNRLGINTNHSRYTEIFTFVKALLISKKTMWKWSHGCFTH